MNGGLVRVVKYKNRKLFGLHRYVSLREIANLVSMGYRVRVFEYQTGRDISTEILAEAIYDAERKQPQFDIRLLEEVLRKGGKGS